MWLQQLSQNVWRRLLLFVGFAAPAAAPVPSAVLRSTTARDVERGGTFYFRGAILDRLDDYFRYIKKMKQTDLDGYHLLRQIGAVMVTKDVATCLRREWRFNNSVGFGAVAFGESAGPEFVPVQFVYFLKLKDVPPRVEPALAEEAVYKVVVFWADDSLGFSDVLYYAIGASSQPRLLKVFSGHRTRVRAKGNFGQRRGSGFSVTHQSWDYPHILVDMYGRQKGERSFEDYASEFFTIFFNLYVQSSLGVRVSVRKKKLVAAFSVDLLRMPYFFSDRGKVKNENGRTRRIFHIVKTHSRQRSDGGVSNVKSHFRGLRRFDWNGYDVVVSMPGKHHRDILDFDLGCYEFQDDEPLPDGHFVEAKSMAKTIGGHMRRISA